MARDPGPCGSVVSSGGSSPVPLPNETSPPSSPEISSAGIVSLLNNWVEGVPAAVKTTMNATIAPNTRKLYSGYFARFLAYIDDRGRNFDTFTEVDVLEFLQSFLDAGSRYNTVNIVWSSIQFFVRRSQQISVCDSWKIRDFMRGAKRVAIPPNPKPSVWDPQLILDMFKRKPHPTTFFAAAAKALALLLLATGFRVDDVSKLSFCVEIFSSRLRIPFIGLRKTDIRGVPSSHLDLESFSDVLICPVRAVLRFLSISRKIRKRNQVALFVSSKGTAATVDTLRRWMRGVFAEAGVTASAGSCRSAATSAAFSNFCPIGDILRMAGWKTDSTFRVHYLRPVVPVQNLLHAYAKLTDRVLICSFLRHSCWFFSSQVPASQLDWMYLRTIILG